VDQRRRGDERISFRFRVGNMQLRTAHRNSELLQDCGV
jgi:hypothetical protein